jgi:hypothetical protein
VIGTDIAPVQPLWYGIQLMEGVHTKFEKGAPQLPIRD